MQNRLIKWIVIMLGFNGYSNAQDPQFSQFYNVSQFVNPAFAGNTEDYRFTFHNRYQWAGLDAQFATQLLTFDKSIPEFNSALGFLIVNDLQGRSNIRSTEFHLQYAYVLTVSSKISFRYGMQAGLVNRSLDYSALVFPDQFIDRGFSGATQENFSEGQSYFLDLGTGGILFSDKFWIGAAFHHINQPNTSFLQEDVPLQIRSSLHVGYRLVLKSFKDQVHVGSFNDAAIIPTLHLRRQGNFHQMDLGLYGIYKNVTTGFWYRGIPFRQLEGRTQNNESMVFMLGTHLKNISFTYSYDAVISGLAGKANGAHELNITYVNRSRYEEGRVKKKRRRKIKDKPEKNVKPLKKVICPHVSSSINK